MEREVRPRRPGRRSVDRVAQMFAPLPGVSRSGAHNRRRTRAGAVAHLVGRVQPVNCGSRDSGRGGLRAQRARPGHDDARPRLSSGRSHDPGGRGRLLCDHLADEDRKGRSNLGILSLSGRAGCCRSDVECPRLKQSRPRDRGCSRVPRVVSGQCGYWLSRSPDWTGHRGPSARVSAALLEGRRTCRRAYAIHRSRRSARPPNCRHRGGLPRSLCRLTSARTGEALRRTLLDQEAGQGDALGVVLTPIGGGGLFARHQLGQVEYPARFKGVMQIGYA